MKNRTVIEVNHLSYRYERESVLEDINFSLSEGSFLALIGPNGSGKSTLLKLILGLLRIQSGEIFLFGKKIPHFKNWEKIGYVSQKANAFNTGFPATVREVVASGLTKKLGLFARMGKQDWETVREAVGMVGMEKYMNRNIGELSGGQQQRVFIARALVSRPELLILDEPTVGVDAKSNREFLRLLAELNQKFGLTLLLVTHHLEEVTDIVTHVACLNKKLLFYGEEAEYRKYLSGKKSLYDVFNESLHPEGANL